MRSAMEVSSQEGQSSCSEEADCSQSDISLCDDGASEEEGEGANILGHLNGRGQQDTSSAREDDESHQDEGMEGIVSYECEDDEANDSLQHAKNSMSGKLRVQQRSSDSCKLTRQDEAETAWNFNDLWEFAE